MARQTKVPELERQIGARLRSFRTDLLISQTSFALKAGVSRENLAKYEFAVVPLTWSAGEALCRTHDINQVWLATGTELKRPYVGPPGDLIAAMMPRARFSEVYPEYAKEDTRSVAFAESNAFFWIMVSAYKNAFEQLKRGEISKEAFDEVELRVQQVKKALDQIKPP